jgi:hypothetical protein
MGSGTSGGEGEHINRVSVRSLDGECGIRIDDRIERRHCEIRTDRPSNPTPADETQFRYPVDTAVQLTAGRLTFEGFSRTFVHDGPDVTEVEYFESVSFDDGHYTLELSGPVKLYVELEGAIDVQTTVTEMDVSLSEATSVRIGARSYHEQPAATVTTTDDPTDVMAAVSTFGSAMKTTGSERSYPTLRGHPPTLQRGSSLSVPSGLQPPETDVHIEVPESLFETLAVAPLAYYLGAEVVPGSDPQLVVDGEPFSLEGDGGFERTVERTLKRTFFLDCVVRTAGPRSIPLYERRAVESSLDIDLSDLYGRSGAERLAAYNTVDYDTISSFVPTWKLTAHVDPVGSSLEVLPFLVDDLAVVRSPSQLSVAGDDPFAQDADPFEASTPDDGEFVRSTTRSPSDSSATPTQHVQPDQADSLEQTWVGEGTPLGASKAIPEAFRNRLDREPREGDIEIVVVCNDEEMLEERDVAAEVYGSREEFPIDVTFYEDLTTDRLALVLESDVDFFHYIGHVDEGGFECSDGLLDADSVGDIELDIFFLNACRSYRQGRRLIEKGAISGVVTLDDVINSGAVRIGKTLAKLLNYGFPLRSALNIARERSIVGTQYLVIGDGNADIAQHQGNVPVLVSVDTESDEYDVTLTTYATSGFGMGTQYRPPIQGVKEVYLCPGTLPTFNVSEQVLEEYLSMVVLPVQFDGTFGWSDTLSLSDLL